MINVGQQQPVDADGMQPMQMQQPQGLAAMKTQTIGGMQTQLPEMGKRLPQVGGMTGSTGMGNTLPQMGTNIGDMLRQRMLS